LTKAPSSGGDLSRYLGVIKVVIRNSERYL
jgi:hypothetical protein